MGISVEERRAISRRNGARSRGPVTDSGKYISSRNNMRHGFYAKVHHLPDEDPDETARLRQRWFADMGPKSVAEEFLTNECFQANLQANRVHRTRRAVVTAQQEAATASWHDQRDEVVGRLCAELETTDDARDVMSQLRTTTLGLDALSAAWSRPQGQPIDAAQGYWLPEELGTAVLLSGIPVRTMTVSDDADAYRLTLWNFQCEPEPPRDTIERLLKPANRPPELKGAADDLVLPPAAECLARLKQWVADVLAELGDEWDRVWTTTEAPYLARRTDPRAIVVDREQERRIHRASTEYRAMYYKAFGALEAIRKREAAAEREATRNADRKGSPRSSEGNGTTGRVAPAVAPVADAEACSRDEPSTGSEPLVAAEPPVSADVTAADSRDEPSTRLEAPAAARSPEPGTQAAGALNPGPWPATGTNPAPGSEDGSLTRQQPLPGHLDPMKSWEELTPEERSAVEALNRATLMDVLARVHVGFLGRAVADLKSGILMITIMINW